MKRVFIILASLIFLAGMGVVIYFAFFLKPAGIEVGTPQVTLPSAGQGTSTPQGSSVTGTPNGTGSSSGSAVSVIGRLVKISVGPVVPGEVVLNIKPEPKTASSTASSTPEVSITYIERESGNVFSYLIQKKSLTRTSNRTLPSIQSADWLPDGSMAFVRYLSGTDFSTINTYALSANSLATSSGGFFLAQNIHSLVVSSTTLLSLVSGVNGSVASLMRTDGTRPTTLFSSPLTSLRASFAGKNQYLVFSKPTGTLAGYAFFVDSTGRFSRIAGPLRGLSALASTSGKWVFVSYTDSGTLHTELVDVVLGKTLLLPVGTIADKCVWARDDSAVYCGVPISVDNTYLYPDDWYQGAVHFSDRIWKIDVAGRYAQLVLDFSQAKDGDLDAEALAIDPANTTLVFINKNTGSLWSYSF